MSTVAQFIALCTTNGSDVHYRRSDSVIPCPCLTPEGFRDPQWHIDNPTEPVCNEDGYLSDPAHTVDMQIKGFVQPIQSTRATRLSTEYVEQLFGIVEADDHLAILPCSWSNVTLNFRDWSQDGDDYIEYDGQRFLVINANKIPDPDDGNPNHHWELGLRLINDAPLDNVVMLRPVENG